MAKKVTPLTNTQITQCKPKDKVYNLSDGNNLALRIKPNGSKSWLFTYCRPFTKKRAVISFGMFPAVSLAEARKQCTNARELLAQNIDPKSHKDDLVDGEKAVLKNTFGKSAIAWYELKQQKVKSTTASKAWQKVEKYFLPSLAEVPISAIKPMMVVELLQPVVNQGKRETVKRLCCHLNEIMRSAVIAGHIESNSFTDITKLFPAPDVTNMASIRPEELPEFMSALATTNIHKSTQCLIL